MTDVLMLAIVASFFGLSVGFVDLCDRIVSGARNDETSDRSSGLRHGTDPDAPLIGAGR